MNTTATLYRQVWWGGWQIGYDARQRNDAWLLKAFANANECNNSYYIAGQHFVRDIDGRGYGANTQGPPIYVGC